MAVMDDVLLLIFRRNVIFFVGIFFIIILEFFIKLFSTSSHECGVMCVCVEWYFDWLLFHFCQERSFCCGLSMDPFVKFVCGVALQSEKRDVVGMSCDCCPIFCHF